MPTPWRYEPITARRQRDSQEFQAYANQRVQEESGGGGGGGLLGDIWGGVSDVGSAIADIPGVSEAGGAIADVYSGAQGQLQSLLGAAGGLTGTERRLDPSTGQYYRETGGFGDVLEGWGNLLSDPVGTWQDSETAYEEYFRNPEKGWLTQAAAGAVVAPETYVTAGAGGLLGQGLRQAGPLGRLGANVVEPVAGGSFARRAVGELGLETGARAGAEALGERFGPAGAILGGLGGGLGGAQVGRAIPGSQPFRQAGQTATEQAGRQAARQVEDTGQLGSTAIGGSQTRLFPEVDMGARTQLRKHDYMMNSVKNFLGVGTPEDPIMTPIIRQVDQLRRTIPDSQATRMESLASEGRRVFSLDKQGRALDVTPNATIQDIAARFPVFRPLLNDDQVRWLENMRDEFSTLQVELREAGIDVGTRPDVMEGGFYLPRGSAAKEGVDMPRKVKTGAGRTGTKPGSLRHATIESMSDGIAQGFEYPSLEESIRTYVKRNGEMIYDQRLADELKGLTDPQGNPLGQTARDRVAPELRERYQDAQKRIVRLRERLRTAERRAGIEGRASDELDSALDDVVEGSPAGGFRDVSRIPTVLREQGRRSEGLRGRAGELRSETMRSPEGFPEARISMPATERAMRGADVSDLRAEEIERTLKNVEQAVPEDLERVRFMDTAIRNTAMRAEALAKRGGDAGRRAETLREQLKQAQDEFDRLRPDYRKAVENARATPPDQQTIAMANMSGYTFPIDMANAINKRLVQETGPIENTINTLNQILRGLAATADASFIGIQGLISGAISPPAFARAVRLATQSFWDSDVHRKAIQQMDQAFQESGMATSREWAGMGLRIGAHRTEYEVASRGALGRMDIGKLPVIEQSNRAFGNFGDLMRLQLANTIAQRAAKQGKNIADPKVMREIADVSNLATGWSPNRFGGRAGQWAVFAPRFFQSQLELTARAFTNGDISGGQARRGFATLLGAGTAMTVLANETLENGLDAEEYLAPFTNGRLNSNFMRIRAGGLDISLFGPWDSLARGVSTTAMGLATGDMEKIAYIPRTKASPMLSTAWDLISGETFGDVEPSLTNPEYLLESVMPISVGQVVRDWSDAGSAGGKALLIGTQFAGLKTTPESSYEKAQQVFNASGDMYKVPNADGQMETAKSYWELNNAQRARFEEDHPELATDIQSDPSEELQQYNQVKEMLAKEQQVSDMMLIQNEIGIDEWRDQFNDRRTFLRGAGEALFEGDEERDVESTDDLYNQIIDENTLPDGSVDWDEVDQRVSSLTPQQQQWIADNRALGMTDLSQRYLATGDDRSKYYSLPKYRGYTGDEARQIDDIYDRARATLNLPKGRKAPQMRMLRAIREVQEQYGFDAKVARGARKRVMGMVTQTNDRERFLEEHPEVAVFVGSGYLTPTDQSVISGVDGVLSNTQR